jgi:FdhE protein
MTTNEETSKFHEIIARAVEQNPQSSEILKAFEPIIAGQRQLAAQSSFQMLDCSLIDKEKLKAGVPVSRQINLFLPEDSLKEIAIFLASAVKEGMPQLTENIDQISGLIKEGKINPTDYFKVSPDDENKTANSWINDLKISPSNASFLMSLVSRVALEQRAKEITAALGEFDWLKGYCPICGSFPSIALIEEEGGKRFLHCSSCGHDWRFTRVLCPYCENDAKQGMDYFYIEKKTQESAFVCDKCKKYLVTLYRTGNVFARDMDIAAISLIHLDMIMQDKGYEPMISCAWNIVK